MNAQVLKSSYKHKIKLPFPEAPNKDGFCFRLLFKPESGELWGYHNFFADKELYN